MNFSNLSLTAAGAGAASLLGHLMTELHTKIARRGREDKCKFYHDLGSSGSILMVAAKGVVGGAVSVVKDGASNALNSLLGKKKKDPKPHPGTWAAEVYKKQQEEEKEQFGMMQVPEGQTVYALDDWGNISPDALMLAIETENEVTIEQHHPSYRKVTKMVNGKEQEVMEKYYRDGEAIKTKTLVWYDTTALIRISSNKNLVVTKVQGRDYSRKELVSNGDIKFSVSGQITSRLPEIYPAEEIKKFIKVMQYKGVVQVKNQVLSQFGIDKLVIVDFNLDSKEGYKSVQNYSFSAIGLQPEKEIEITQDTLKIIEIPETEPADPKSEWEQFLADQLESLKSMTAELGGDAINMAGNMLENLL